MQRAQAATGADTGVPMVHCVQGKKWSPLFGVNGIGRYPDRISQYIVLPAVDSVSWVLDGGGSSELEILVSKR